MLSVASFVVALGLLITVHELGHFWVARKLGVKVLRFSIGFGSALWKRRAGPDETEYVVAALPLGGYVKMLDEREGEVDPREVSRAFNRQSVGTRMAIVVAGPVMNLVFAVAAYWVMFILGVTSLRPIVGEVTPGSPAARAGLTEGAEVVAVDGRPTPTWEAVTIALVDAALDREDVSLETVDGSGKHHTRVLNLERGSALMEGGDVLQNIGIRPGRPFLAPVIDKVEADGPAARAGLQSGDRIVSADGEPIADWGAWVKYVRARPDTPIRVVVQRGAEQHTLVLTPGQQKTAQGVIGHIGAAVRVPEDYLERLQTVVRYSPAAALGAAVDKTWEMSALTLHLLGKMLIGQASVENLSGPITIAQYAGQSASYGLVPFLAFLGLVSLSLGVLNLLPIPVLDGGHLMYYLIELVKGSPVSEQTLAWGQKLGIAILLGLMSLAIINDFARLLGS